MSKKYYVAPLILDANGTISMTVSQLGALGLNPTNWDAFWEDSGDYVNEYYPDFDINDKSTWPDFFEPDKPWTWDQLTDDPEEP